jgi:hypothetical protein
VCVYVCVCNCAHYNVCVGSAETVQVSWVPTVPLPPASRLGVQKVRAIWHLPRTPVQPAVSAALGAAEFSVCLMMMIY